LTFINVLVGIMSFFESRRPTFLEMENPQTYPQIIMTYDLPEWDPYDLTWTQSHHKVGIRVGFLLGGTNWGVQNSINLGKASC
jgi:hypothetical protein